MRLTNSFSYLHDLSELCHEDLDEDDTDLAVHNHKLPEVRLGSVPIVKEAILGFEVL